jgi:hypothetical protein
MNAMRKQAADELPVRYRVRVSVPTDRKLRDGAGKTQAIDGLLVPARRL